MIPKVSVIIATAAAARRAPLLARALGSLLSNQGETVIPIVVVNGSRFDSEAVEVLRRRRDLRFLHLEEGSAVKARLAGRAMVDTEFFAMLDDDDEYLPGAVQARLACLLRDASVAAVVTNGYQTAGGCDQIRFPEFASFPSDPLGRLMDHPWLTSAAGLYRTERVGPEYFECPQYMEMTYMGICLALTRKLHFLDVPTYRLHHNSPGSLSLSEGYLYGEAEALRWSLALQVPKRIRRRLERKYIASLHSISDFERRNGNYRAAWSYHLKSLLSPWGVRHVFYTRHLVRSLAPPHQIQGA